MTDLAKTTLPTHVTAKIENGRVKIAGCYFTPSKRHLPYDGRLDGKEYMFGVFYKYNKKQPSLALYLYLWGPEENYILDPHKSWLQDPQIIEEIGYPWMWWYTEERICISCAGSNALFYQENEDAAILAVPCKRCKATGIQGKEWE